MAPMEHIFISFGQLFIQNQFKNDIQYFLKAIQKDIL